MEHYARNHMILRASLVAVVATASAACINGPAVLTQHVEARRLAADLQLQFTKAADAANRAVMADTDDASSAAADEARQTAQQVQQQIEQLRPILQSLGYADEIRALDAFVNRFDEYRKLDDEILPLAVENTNLKAQRLSFGAAHEAVLDFRRALDGVATSSGGKDVCCRDAHVAKAVAALLEIQVIQARHIAESDEAAMSRMEDQMSALDQAARGALGQLKAQIPSAGPAVGSAMTALDRFKAVNKEIVTLSRRNSNVRSLALTLGRKRVLLEALDKNRFKATR